MNREELVETIRFHHVNQTWCYGCMRNVGRQADHLADLLMPEGVTELRAVRKSPQVTREQFIEAYHLALSTNPHRAPGRTVINRALQRDVYRSFNGSELGWYSQLMQENGFERRGSRWFFKGVSNGS